MEGIGNKKYYKIKEVSEMLAIPVSTIRFWENEFKQLSPRRSKTNIRYYTPQDIETLKLINYLARVKGLKLEAAREELAQNSANVSNRVELLDKLKSVKQSLENIKSSLTKRNE